MRRPCAAVAVLVVLRIAWQAGYNAGMWQALRTSWTIESARIRAEISTRQLVDRAQPAPRPRRWSR